MSLVSIHRGHRAAPELKLALSLAVSLLLAACASAPVAPQAGSQGSAETTPQTATKTVATPAVDTHATEGELPSLAEAYKPFFPVGAAINPGQVMLGDNAFIKRQYSIVVAENAMKPAELNRAGPGKYTFTNADGIADFAARNGLKLRGHALVWHQQAADWMFEGSGPNGVATRDELVARMRTYIHDVVGHFKGRVYAWDVVNEAFNPDEGGSVGGWRNSKWYQIIGPDFIALAFQFAHEADPDALLFYNDYSTEKPEKRRLIVALIQDLQKRGIAIHGIGHQSHYTISQPGTFIGLEESIKAVGELGLTNHITELDISMNANLMHDAVTEITPDMEDEQAERYHDFMAMCLRQRQYVSAVLTWGMNDDTSWLRTWPFQRLDAPLLFDGEFQPKPAFWALLNLGRNYPR